MTDISWGIARPDSRLIREVEAWVWLPATARWCVYCRLQWRDRAGLAPASALRVATILRAKLRDARFLSCHFPDSRFPMRTRLLLISHPATAAQRKGTFPAD